MSENNDTTDDGTVDNPKITESSEEGESDSLSLSRRSALTGAGALGLLGMGVGTASARTGDYFEDYEGDPNKAGIRARTQGAPGFKAKSRANTGVTRAVYGIAESDSGRGVVGFASSTSGDTYGIQGIARSPDGIALFGKNRATQGPARGLVGVTDSPEGRGLDGVASQTSGNSTGTRGVTNSDQGTGVLGQCNSSSGTTYGVRGTVDSPDGYGLYTPDDAKVGQDLEVGGSINEVTGDLKVQGTKNFVQAVDTPTGPKEVVYTATEAPTPRTEVSDVAELSDGWAEIDLPAHFDMVTSEDESIIVQVTPYAEEQVSLQVVERSTERIVVEDVSDVDYDYTFAYTVKGTRDGFEDRDVVREK